MIGGVARPLSFRLISILKERKKQYHIGKLAFYNFPGCFLFGLRISRVAASGLIHSVVFYIRAQSIVLVFLLEI